MPFAQTLVAVAIVSAISLVGAVTLAIRAQALRRGLLILVSFAAGALLGDAFIHLIPEIAESDEGFGLTASITLIGGVLLFFVLEKILHWHHAHVASDEVLHPVAVTNLVGDGLHNLVDGAIIAGAFLASPKLGVATTVAVALHEIPQEIGDFGILIHAGMKPRRALLFNLLSGLVALVGAIATLLASSVVSGLETWLLPLTAGGFVYIASTDLLPELHREPEPVKSALQLVALIVGVAVMVALAVFE